MTATTAEVCADEEVTRDEVALAIVNLNHRAKREFPSVGNADHPTPWDIRHAAINRHLTDWQRTPA